LDGFVGKRVRRQYAGGIAGMDAGFFDMFHDAADIDFVTVTQRVRIDFDRAVEIAVEKYRLVTGYEYGVVDILFEFGGGLHDLHALAAENVRRADDEREADILRFFDGFAAGAGEAVIG